MAHFTIMMNISGVVPLDDVFGTGFPVADVDDSKFRATFLVTTASPLSKEVGL
jgi:hypothetical protein